MRNIEKILKEEKIYIAKTEGNSMFPMLMEGKDTVIILPPSFPLKKCDVPVYRKGNHYTMHRIIKITKKGYIICGDNRKIIERGIQNKDIVGVLFAFYHDGKMIKCDDKKYIKYAKRICRKKTFLLFKDELNLLYRKLFPRKTCESCETGESIYKTDNRSPFCPYLNYYNEDGCSFYKKRKNS